MKTKFVIAAALAATAVSAQAQTGLRADIHAGWDGVSTHQRTDVGTSGATTILNDDGVVYGLELGYDYKFGAFNLGLYGGIDGATTERCSEVFAEIETCERSGRNLTAGVRAGFNVAGRAMLYVKGGYSNGQVKLDYIDHVTAANSFTASESMDGYHIGGGVQVDLFSNVYAKVEYVRTDYKDYTFKEGTATIKGGLDRDNVVFGVGIKF